MTPRFDQHGINHMVSAISREMNPGSGRRPADSDTLFMGGPRPRDADEDALGTFAQRKNYQIIFASFDCANPANGPLDFHAVVTDGLNESIVLFGGRLWKRNRSSPAILLFPGTRAAIRLSSKGRLIAREMTGRFEDQGYDLAAEAIRTCALRKPGGVPVVAPIGGLMTVMDMGTLADTFAAAA